MMHFQTFRRRFGDTVCGNLVLLNLSFFVLLIVTAIVLGLATSEPSTRTRYHAIPVALSQLYHDRTHDYTSYRSIAQSFQGSPPIDEVSKHWSENSPQDLDSTYFWLADDRGLSDVIYLGFLVLGPSMFSIFAAYMFLVLCGLIGYLVAFRDNVTALSLSAVGLLTLTAFLPVFVRAPGLTFAEQSVHISETRLIEFFAFIPALFLIVSLVLRPALNARWLVGLAMSAVLLAFALHIRSSITWLVLSLFFISLLYFSWTLFFRRDRAFLLVCALLAVAPVGALVGVKAYLSHPA